MLTECMGSSTCESDVCRGKAVDGADCQEDPGNTPCFADVFKAVIVLSRPKATHTT